MNEEHHGASSFIYNDQFFVVGGNHSKTIETLDLNELPSKWMKFPGELPYVVRIIKCCLPTAYLTLVDIIMTKASGLT